MTDPCLFTTEGKKSRLFFDGRDIKLPLPGGIKDVQTFFFIFFAGSVEKISGSVFFMTGPLSGIVHPA